MSAKPKLTPQGTGMAGIVAALKAKAPKPETTPLDPEDQGTDEQNQAQAGLKVRPRASALPKALPKAPKGPAIDGESLYRLAEGRSEESAILRPTVLDADDRGITLFVPWSQPAIGSGDPPAIFLTDGRRSFPVVDVENRLLPGVNLKACLSLGQLRKARPQ